MQPDYFTAHVGFIADYIAEIFHKELRQRNYTDAYERFFSLGSHVEERDRKAAVRTVSGLIRLLHPDGKCSKEELRAQDDSSAAATLAANNSSRGLRGSL